MMKQRVLVTMVMLTLFVFFLGSCKETTKPEPDEPNTAAANVLAREGMDMLNQVILDMSETEPEFSEANDVMLQSTFQQIEGKFNSALQLDATNPMGSLGMAILEIVRINYDQELWNMIDDSMDMAGGSKRILNNQFQFLAKTPMMVVKQMNPDKTNAMSIMRVQNYIKGSILPRLSNSISLLNRAVALADSNVIIIDTGEEFIEADCGEIFAFRATVHAVSAAFNMMVAYNMDMVDSNGGYNWINDMANVHVQSVNTWDPYAYSLEDGHLYLDYYEDGYRSHLEEAMIQEIQGRVMRYNMDNIPSFGTIANQQYLTAAKNAIINAAADVRNCTNYILAEDDAQNDDIIKIENITSLNDQFPIEHEGAPNFMLSWMSINDVATWLESIVNSPYQMNENNVAFTVNLSAFFAGAVADIREVLPYHIYNEASSWIEPTLEYHSFQTSYWHFWYEGEFKEFHNLTSVTRRYHGVKLVMGQLTNENGVPIDEDELPYFPDYEFKGILPGMNRTKLDQLLS